MKVDMSEEQRAAVAKRIVALASQMAPSCEGEALHSAVMYWLDEEVISEDDPDIAKVNEGLGRLSGKMQALGGVPGRTKGQPAPSHETLFTEEEAVSVLRFLLMRRTEQVCSGCPVTFAIDFDGVWLSDPALFSLFVDLLEARGHQAIMVTGRSDVSPWADEVRRVVAGRVPIVFAGSRWKRTAAEEEGYRVSVWVDDHPEFIGEQAPDLLAGKRRRT